MGACEIFKCGYNLVTSFHEFNSELSELLGGLFVGLSLENPCRANLFDVNTHAVSVPFLRFLFVVDEQTADKHNQLYFELDSSQ